MNVHDFYSAREALLASMHGKEQAIAPWLKTELNINLHVAKNLDTDQFGTFSGEIDREYSPEETSRLKIEEVFRQNPRCRVALSSEGSFFPNPECLLSTVNEELLLLMDRKTGVEVMVKYYSTQTNMAKTVASSLAEVLEFAGRTGFPGHGLILKVNPGTGKQEACKGITSFDLLERVFQSFILKSETGIVAIETDMRACYNPTRMEKIGLAAQGLVLRLKTVCPACNYPGFGITEYRKGLPCETCQVPTRLLLSHFYQCKSCGYSTEEKFPEGNTAAYAGYCYHCNP